MVFISRSNIIKLYNEAKDAVFKVQNRSFLILQMPLGCSHISMLIEIPQHFYNTSYQRWWECHSPLFFLGLGCSHICMLIELLQHLLQIYGKLINLDDSTRLTGLPHWSAHINKNKDAANILPAPEKFKRYAKNAMWLCALSVTISNYTIPPSEQHK